MMKWMWIVIALAFLLNGYAPQFRTHYTPQPALARARQVRIWAYERPQWVIAVAIVRIA